MGSSTYCLDMDYLLVCIVSRQSRVSVPHLVKKKKKKKKKKTSFNKISYSFETNSMSLARYALRDIIYLADIWGDSL